MFESCDASWRNLRAGFQPRAVGLWIGVDFVERRVDCRFAAIQAGDTLLFTEQDYIAIREARRKSLSRSTGPAAAAPGPAPASKTDIERRLAKLRAEYWPTKGKPKKTSSGRRGRVLLFSKPQ
jgi:hypothetical protein